MRGQLDGQKPAWTVRLGGWQAMAHTLLEGCNKCTVAWLCARTCPVQHVAQWPGGGWVQFHQTCRWYQIGKNRLKGRSVSQRDRDRLEEQVDTGTLRNFMIISAKFCTWKSWQTARCASMNQQQVLAAKMDNSILGYTKHWQKIQGPDYHSLLGTC